MPKTYAETLRAEPILYYCEHCKSTTTWKLRSTPYVLMCTCGHRMTKGTPPEAEAKTYSPLIIEAAEQPALF